MFANLEASKALSIKAFRSLISCLDSITTARFAHSHVSGVFSAGVPRIGHGEVRVYRGTGVSRGVRRTTWERSLKIWELQIACFEEFLGGENVLGLVPASLPHTLGYACTSYAPTSPPPKERFLGKIRKNFLNREMLQILVGHRERRICREPWLGPALDLVPTFCAGCVSKSTVTTFSSFSD